MLLKTDELDDGFIRTGDPARPKIPVQNLDEARRAAKTQWSPAVHPAQLYSTFNALLIMAVLLAYFTLPHVPGRAMAMMLMLEGPSRFLLEMLRVEPPVLGQMSLSMVLGLILFVFGVLLWFALALGDRGDCGRPGRHLSPREALGEDNPERLRRSHDCRRRRRLLVVAAHAGDG